MDEHDTADERPALAGFPETGWPVPSREVMAMLRPVGWAAEPEADQGASGPA